MKQEGEGEGALGEGRKQEGEGEGVGGIGEGGEDGWKQEGEGLWRAWDGGGRD